MTKYTVSDTMIGTAMLASVSSVHSGVKRMREILEAALEVMEKERDAQINTKIADYMHHLSISDEGNINETAISNICEIFNCRPSQAKGALQIARKHDLSLFNNFPAELPILSDEKKDGAKQPDAGGWIEHIGDECPVDGDIIVEVRGILPRSYICRAAGGNDKRIFWDFVTHYRIVKPAAEKITSTFSIHDRPTGRLGQVVGRCEDGSIGFIDPPTKNKAEKSYSIPPEMKGLTINLAEEKKEYCKCKPISIDYIHRKTVDGTKCNGCKLSIKPSDASYMEKPQPKKQTLYEYMDDNFNLQPSIRCLLKGITAWMEQNK